MDVETFLRVNEPFTSQIDSLISFFRIYWFRMILKFGVTKKKDFSTSGYKNFNQEPKKGAKKFW